MSGHGEQEVNLYRLKELLGAITINSSWSALHVLSVKKGGCPNVVLRDDLLKKMEECPCPKCLAIIKRIYLTMILENPGAHSQKPNRQ